MKKLKFRHSTRKWALGKNACGNCRAYQHQNCRPKLDGTVCSCQCPSSRLIRRTIADQVLEALKQDAPIPSVESCVKPIHPRYSPSFFVDLVENSGQQP